MGTLYIISTPIGNLGDITLRALDTLKSVDSILCEDTRVTRRLLEHYKISTPTTSYHQHSSTSIQQKFIIQLQKGKNLALVTDAGTPGISDPGQVLIQLAIQHSIPVVPLPGPSAVITALQASGIDTSRFEFLGFLPHKKGRKTLLEYISQTQHTIVCYESPHRILKTLDALRASNVFVIVARELTKVYEEFVRGNVETVYQELAQRPIMKGEIVLIITPALTTHHTASRFDDTATLHLNAAP